MRGDEWRVRWPHSALGLKPTAVKWLNDRGSVSGTYLCFLSLVFGGYRVSWPLPTHSDVCNPPSPPAAVTGRCWGTHKWQFHVKCVAGILMTRSQMATDVIGGTHLLGCPNVSKHTQSAVLLSWNRNGSTVMFKISRSVSVNRSLSLLFCFYIRQFCCSFSTSHNIDEDFGKIIFGSQRLVPRNRIEHTRWGGGEGGPFGGYKRCFLFGQLLWQAVH
jgi:hypothetical protein